MKLYEDGIYMTAMIKRFWLVEEVEQLINVPSIVEALYFVKVNAKRRKKFTRFTNFNMFFTGRTGFFQRTIKKQKKKQRN